MNVKTCLTGAFYAAAALLNFGSAYAAQCERQSPAHRLALVELYTSEGCNSCPPADRWLRQIDTRSATDRDIVPLALHVDYWDNLGWRDVFGQHLFTERQEQLTRLGQTHFSYTPEVFISGREFRNWRSEGDFRSALKALNSKPAAADIHLTWMPVVDNSVKVNAQFSLPPPGPGAAAQTQAYLALYENRLHSKVGAGENNGATLQHDYVVRQWRGPIPIRQDGKAAIAETFTIPATDSNRDSSKGKRPDLGVAAFVQDAKTGEILQALSLPAC